MILTLEEMSLNAWPSLQQVLLDGWVLRFSHGYTRRANSINPIYPGTLALPEKIAYCERLYQAHKLPVIVKITPAVQPAGLDEILMERGYTRQAESEVMTHSVPGVPHPRGVHCCNDRPDDWLAAYTNFSNLSPMDSRTHATIITALAVPHMLALALDGDTPVACGLGILDRGYLGLFDIITHPEYRRQGHGTRVLHVLFAWAYNHGVQHTYLQVMTSNLPALTLYRRLGFQSAYTYWYRVRS